MHYKLGSAAATAAMMLLACAITRHAWAGEAYPARPIRLIALGSPGSGPDIIGRLVGTRLTEAWAQQVIVDTRPGASGIIGAGIAAKAAPDGYTLVIITSQAAIVSVMYENLPYRLDRDFSPISLIGSTPFILAVHPAVAATSVKELVALAKAKPGELRYGSGGSGSPPHLSVEILRSLTGINLHHVPYKGITPAMTDAIAGQVHMLMSVIPAVLTSVQSGRLRALGITSAQRSALMPELPTIAETVPGYEFIGWASVFAPAGTPRVIIDKLNAQIVKAVHFPGVRDRLAALGFEVASSTPQELAAYLAVQTEKMRTAVRVSGARPDR